MLDIKTAKTRLHVGKLCHVPGESGHRLLSQEPLVSGAVLNNNCFCCPCQVTAALLLRREEPRAHLPFEFGTSLKNCNLTVQVW